MEKHKIPTQLLRKPNSTINLLPAPQEVQISAQKVFFDNRAIPQVCQKRSPNHRLNYSFVYHQKPKSYSPAYSAVSSQHEEYYKSIESSLLSENRNLKEHTDFLSSQIRSMFQKQKRQCELLKSWKNKCKELETLNIELQQLLYRFTNQTLSTIKRIQKILTLQKFREEELLLSSLSKSQQLCTQTEETINNNLQELKTQISSILTVCSPKKVLITPPTKQAERDLESNKQSKNSKAYSSHFTDFNKIESKPKSKQQKEYSFYDGSPPKTSFNQLI